MSITACVRSPAARVAPYPQDAASILTAMQRARSSVTSYTAEARVTSLGPEGRRRVTVLLAAMRPASLSYQVLGPHGAPLEMFATDGVEMQLFNTATRRFVYGPASPANLDALLDGLGLRQDAATWVSLFFGEIPVPATASLQQGGHAGMAALSWTVGHTQHVLSIDPTTHTARELLVRRPDAASSRLRILQRESHGLPTGLVIELTAPNREVRIDLRDIATDGALAPDTFRLEPPAGAHLEHRPD